MKSRPGVLLGSAAFLVSLASCQVVSGLNGVDLDGKGDGTGGGSAAAGGPSGTVCIDTQITIAEQCGSTFLDSTLVNPTSHCASLPGPACKTACKAASAMSLACSLAAATSGCKFDTGGTCGSCTRDCACPGSRANCFSACEASCETVCGGDAKCQQACPGTCTIGCEKLPNSCAAACAAACRPSTAKACVDAAITSCENNVGMVDSCVADCAKGPVLFCEGVWMQGPANPKGCIQALQSLGVDVQVD
jgi:hypothetical protein